jgi:hypothetical protein
MSPGILEPPSCGHWCEQPCGPETCECPPCDCADCKRRRHRAETEPLFAAVAPTRRRPVQLPLFGAFEIDDDWDRRVAAREEQA